MGLLLDRKYDILLLLSKYQYSKIKNHEINIYNICLLLENMTKICKIRPVTQIYTNFY